MNANYINFNMPKAIEGVFPLINAAIAYNDERAEMNLKVFDKTKNINIQDYAWNNAKRLVKQNRINFLVYIGMRLLIIKQQIKTAKILKTLATYYEDISDFYFFASINEPDVLKSGYLYRLYRIYRDLHNSLKFDTFITMN